MLDIRVALRADSELLADHNCAMALETENKRLDPQVALEGVYGLFERPQFGFYLIAEVDTCSAGSLMVTYEWSDWRNGLFWWIQSVYIRPRYRRQGLYRAMYQRLKDLAGDNPDQVCGFRLYAETENIGAHHSYEKVGMQRCDYLMFEESCGQSLK